jgi:DNA-directed RNA polymerase subunit RPC12/RpoP
MSKIQYKCYDCESEYRLVYHEDDVADQPQYCPFCSAYIIREEIEEDSDKYYVEEEDEEEG